ncbi:PxKF domain-containing protein [Vulcaniibacterium gelatinicum]|uniref:PxKF domain-containing protein n=1 Tax=Vulcaniibacterium gelatinicum TaxID=2598725 RepID=UPI0015F2D78E|nr:PxKF domain-containing protein [Vulcaniibacterium gelatinicum]
MSSGSAPAALRGWAPLLLATLLAAPFPTQAACTGNPNARVDPLSQTVPETTGGAPTVVVLDGSKSTPNQPDLGYAWQYLGSTPSGFTVSLSGANTATASFAAPNVPVGGASLQFRLTVTCGTRTSSTTTTINVTDVVVNTPPTPVAVAVPENAAEGTLVTLDGSASYDLDPGTTLSYQWTQIGGSPTVLLSSANPAGSIVTFVAPNLPATTSLTFRLTVSDGSLSASANRIVNILWSNDPPVASLVCPGGLIEADEGALVTLDGSGSSDPDGTIASYTWDQYAGLPNLGLGAHATPTIAFSAPALGYQQTGALQVRLTVTDDQGASASAECGLFVHDVTPPLITVPGDLTVEADSAAGAAVSYAVTAQDAVDDEFPYPLACTPPSGSVFPLAAAPAKALATPVACAATDSAGNTANAGFTITVQDTTPPVITVPGALGVEATGADGAVAHFDATTLDVVDGAGVADCTPPSGSTFPLGDTTVTCTASDARGNPAAPAAFILTVHDTTPPTIEPHADLGPIEATGPSGAVVTYTSPATTDLVDGVGTATCLPASGSTFPLGTSTVTCTAADAAGNAATPTQFQVTVADTTPPVIAAHADVSATAASSAGAVVSYTPPTATDLVDGPVAVTCTPASGSTFPVGPSTVQCSATDNAGNTGNSSFIVQVSYAWTGFFRPVDNAPTLNTVRAGSAVPVKFSLGGDMGLAIFAAGHPRAALMACASGAVEDVVEETVTAGGSTLTYDAVAKQYVYVWKTDKAWAGSCRQLQIRFADGSLRVANFKLTK